MSARATGSPSQASSVTSGPVTARPDARSRPSALSGSSSATFRAARPIASPDTYASRHPRPGQPPGHGGPFSSMTMWPSSGPAPIVPVASRPATTIPPPIPVPIVRRRASVAPCAAPAAPLHEHRRVRVVVDLDRQPGALAHDVGERQVRDRQVHRGRRDPAPVVHEARDAEADADHRIPCSPTRLLDGLGDRVEERCGVGVGYEPLGAVMDPEVRVDHARQELRASQVDADHAGA